MTLRRVHPLSLVAALQNEMDRMFSGTPFNPGGLRTVSSQFPALNMWDTEDTLFAEIEVPGIPMEQLDLSIERGELRIDARRGAEPPKDAVFHRRERPTGEFVRTIALPVSIDVDQVAAELNDGILTIRMPKAAAARPRKISVRDGAAIKS